VDDEDRTGPRRGPCPHCGRGKDDDTCKWEYVPLVKGQWVGYCFRCQWEGPLEHAGVALPGGGPVRKPLTPHAINRVIHRAFLNGPTAVAEWIQQHVSSCATYDGGWLTLKIEDLWSRFGVGVGGTGSLIVPYSNRSGRLVTYKWRRPGEPIRSLSGSTFFDLLYGEWLLTDDHRTVVLCEGESDTWTAAQGLAGDPEIVALGVPTGAGTGADPLRLRTLGDRDVVVAFDNDRSGNQGAERWLSALGNRATRVVPTNDIRAMGSDAFGALVRLHLQKGR